MKTNLKNRLFDFAVDVFNLLKEIPDNGGYQIYKNQLLKCSSSTGANYEESQAGSSRADFINKVLISLKEIRESNFFLRLLNATFMKEKLKTEFARLILESEEIKRILGAIASKSRGTNKGD
jgi:four helix bundle protein